MILIIKHIEIEGPGTLGDFLKEHPFSIKVVELGKNEPLPEIDDCEGIISLGGPMNVYQEEEYPFLKQEEDFLKQALRKEIPILGICLGAQLLAKVSGARVHKAQEQELGWYRVRLTSDGVKDRLFRGLENELVVFQWHEDTFDIPSQGVLLASSPICRNQAVRIGQFAWGLQFHPEITPRMLTSWLEYYQEELDEQELLGRYSQLENSYPVQARRIYQNFIQLVKERSKRWRNRKRWLQF